MDNYYLVKSLIYESSSNNYLLHLDREHYDGCTLTKIPYIETIKTKNYGTLYGIKYCVHSSSGDRLIRITSKDKSFNSFYSFDIYSKKLKPIVGLQCDSVEKDKLITAISKLSKVKSIFKKQSVKEDMSYDTKMMLIQGVAAVIPVLLILGFYIYFKIRQIINWSIEQEAAGALENDINNNLFKKQTKNDPAFADYQTTVDYIEALINNKNMVSLILCGPPGTSKTYMVRRTMYFSGLKAGNEYRIEKGATATIKDVYQLLYDCRDKILVLDDFDTPLKDPDMINFLKSITDTYDRRIISMPRERIITSGQQNQEMQHAPNKFEFRGKILIITNLIKSSLDKALLSRCPTIEVKFDTKKILELIKKMITYVAPSVPIEIKQEVYDYLAYLYKKDKSITIDFRTFKAGIDARLGNPKDWKNMILQAVM